MPLTRISAPNHLPDLQVKALAEAAQDALVDTCNVPAKDLFQLISRFEADAMILDRSFGNVRRSDDACIVEVLFLRGRTDDQKRHLFRQMVERATLAGFRPDDIVIALTENSSADWSLGMGIRYADLVDDAEQRDA
ncbi:tautomerase family protein [Rubrivivax sp. RP6-9]|uniref:tautomerase family protein n=1 Tax=Rubrivivax sp. RP6-9 TaxID=3415750 RepID=UPI003CC66298